MVSLIGFVPSLISPYLLMKDSAPNQITALVRLNILSHSLMTDDCKKGYLQILLNIYRPILRNLKKMGGLLMFVVAGHLLRNHLSLWK